MKMRNTRPLILYPVYAPEGEKVPADIIARMHELEELGTLWVILQVAKQNFSLNRGRVFPFSEPLNTWGSLYAIQKHVRAHLNEEASSAIVHYQSQYFSSEVVGNLLWALFTSGRGHAVAYRRDLAASLHPDPEVGRARALMECFLTAIASITATGDATMTLDGFTGLQAFSPERYNKTDWGWVGRTKWGGALESQVQSHQMNYWSAPVSAEHTEDRDWPSHLGVDMRAVVAMLDNARNLPILQNPSSGIVDQALRGFGQVFAGQPWLNPATAADEVQALLALYNEQTKLGPYLVPTPATT